MTTKNKINTPRLLDQYRKEIAPALMEELGLSNINSGCACKNRAKLCPVCPMPRIRK